MEEAIRATTSTRGPSTVPARILVIDDNDAIRKLLVRNLESESLREVFDARSPQEAREELSQRPFDVVLTDLSMPDGTGLSSVVPTLHNIIGRMVAEPEGRSYIVRVPGASQAPINDEKLAEVLNWMLTEFSSDTLPKNFKPLTAKEVKRARSQLLADPVKYRAELFPDY